MTKYVEISTFERNDYKEFLRKTVFNPMIEQHNMMAEDITGSVESLSNMEGAVEELVANDVVTEDCLLELFSTDVLIESVLHALEEAVLKLNDRINNIGDVTSKPTSFTDLSDTPASYEASKFVKVNSYGTGLEFSDLPISGSGSDLSSLINKDSELEAAIAALSASTGVQFTELNDLITLIQAKDDELEDTITALKTKDEELAAESESIKSSVTMLDNRIALVEGSIDEVKPFEKFYILPLGGQSNMTGFGEILPDLPDPDPRLMQLGVQNSYEVHDDSYASHNTTKEASGYGDKYRLYRPMEDSNLKLIPATPCLDSTHSLFWQLFYSAGSNATRSAGGLVGVGMYLARLMLNYIPDDYGILIVNGTRGSAGFGDENSVGTYFEEEMQCSHDSRRISPTSPIGRAFMDRIKFALDLHPENKLLPVLWFQGESDDNPVDHYNRFKEYVLWFKDQIEEGGYEDRLPTKCIKDFKWFAFGSTKIIYEEDLPGKNYLDTTLNHISTWAYIRPNYDNYAYMMEDPDLMFNANGEPSIISVRIDTDCNGDFFETVIEELADKNITSIASSQTDWHFSTAVLMYRQSSYILNALANYGKCLNIPSMGKWTRPIRGRTGLVHTDNVTFTYDTSPEFSMDVSNGLIVHYDFADESEPQQYLKTGIVTVGFSTPVYTEDSVMGRVLDLTSATSIENTIGFTGTKPAGKSYTVCTSFKFNLDTRMSGQNIFAGANGNVQPRVILDDSNLIVQPFFGGVYPELRKITMSISKANLGAWRGGFDTWQHIAISYDQTTKHMHVILNGCLIESLDLSDTWDASLETIAFGYRSNFEHPFRGQLTGFRIYDRALSPKEVNTLKNIDFDRRMA